MKRLLTCALLALAPACAMTPEMLPTDGPLGRQVARVVERHDAYVAADASLDEATRAAYLDESATAVGLTGLPEVRADVLDAVLTPVMDRHDAYVLADGSLDALESGTYLGSTAGLRSLLAEAGAAIPVQ